MSRIFWIVSLLVGVQAFAETGVSVSEEEASSFASFQIKSEIFFQAPIAADKRSRFNFEIEPVLTLWSHVDLGLEWKLKQDKEGVFEPGVPDAYLTFYGNELKAGGFEFTPSVIGYFPREDRISSFGINPSFKFKTSNFKVSYEPELLKDFYIREKPKKDISVFTANQKWKSSYEFTRNFGIGGTFEWNTSWEDQGDVEVEWEHSQTLFYQFNSNFVIAAGHHYKGSELAFANTDQSEFIFVLNFEQSFGD